MRNQPLLSPIELESRLGEFYAALRQFNEGWYFESHETLEDLWMVTPLPEREMFQGFIQAAAAFVHMVRGEYPGVIKLLDAAIDKLSRFEPERFGVRVDEFVSSLREVRAKLAELGPEQFARFDQSSVPRIGFDPVLRQ